MTDTYSPSAADAVAAAFLTRGKTVAAQFPKIGHTIEGTILDFRMDFQTEQDSGEQMFWMGNKPVKMSDTPDKKGTGLKPVEQLLIEMQCVPTGIKWSGLEYEEVRFQDDDGIRTLYVKGAVQAAVVKAIKDAGGTLERGVYLKVTRGANTKNAAGQRKFTYVAEWTPAAKNPKAAEQFLSAGGEDNPFA